jgi:predicted O-methyltransferase YrrM
MLARKEGGMADLPRASHGYLPDVLGEVDAECRRREVKMLGGRKAARLVELIRQARPATVVEVGTAIGYSGLWIADTLRELGGGRLVTIELDSDRAAEAGQNFLRSGVEGLITQIIGDARTEIARVPEPVDFLFLDGGFENYYPCLMKVREKLRPGSMIVADNAGIGAAEMADYLDYVRRNYDSRTEWFESDLPWQTRDAMEVSTVRVP